MNRSALYAPPSVLTIPGVEYQFAEGVWRPEHAERLHSHYSYLRALVIGKEGTK